MKRIALFLSLALPAFAQQPAPTPEQLQAVIKVQQEQIAACDAQRHQIELQATLAVDALQKQIADLKAQIDATKKGPAK